MDKIKNREAFDERSYCFPDLDPAQFEEIAYQSKDPLLMEFFYRYCEAIILPTTMGAAFSEEEAKELQEDFLSRSFREFADITLKYLKEFNQYDKNYLKTLEYYKPFDLTFISSHLCDETDYPFEANSSNMLNSFLEVLSPYPETLEIREFIEKNYHNEKDLYLGKFNPSISLNMGIQGKLSDNGIAELNDMIALWYVHGYSARVEPLKLPDALQMAFAKALSDYEGFKPSVFITDSLGPNNLPIVVYAKQRNRVILSENPDLSFFGPDNEVEPIRTVLKKKLKLT